MSTTTVDPFLRRQLGYQHQLTTQRDYYRALSFDLIRRHGQPDGWEVEPEDKVALALSLCISTPPTGPDIETHLKAAIEHLTEAHRLYESFGATT